MIAFVTGGTGFIGQKVVKKLVERNYEVIVLVRNIEKANILNKLGVTLIEGNILDPSSMTRGLNACDVVFHLAGWYKLGARDQSSAYETNVIGTKNVLERAVKFGVPRIIYTSSISIYGDTHGLVHDENYQRPADQPFLTEYDRTKWQAHFQVAVPLINQGAPITIVIPGAVYGPNDKSFIGQLMRAYLRGFLIALPGPETVYSFAHVDDIAEGLILAHEKGLPYQSYILAGQSYPLWQIVKIWSTLTNKPPSTFLIPANLIKKLEPVARFLSTYFQMPGLISVDGIRQLGISYIASSEKAQAELGWKIRPIEIGLKDTLDWFTDQQSCSRKS